LDDLTAQDLLKEAWEVFSQASDWEQGPQWKITVAQWRDKYFAYLKAQHEKP
jgi:hypothetical protein